MVREVKPQEKDYFNQTVNHVIQSWQWGEFRQKQGKTVLRLGLYSADKLVSGYQMTVHKTPFISWSIGYLPKCTLPDVAVVEALLETGREQNLVFIKIEPEVTVAKINSQNYKKFESNPQVFKSKKPIFASSTFVIDLKVSEDESMEIFLEEIF